MKNPVDFRTVIGKTSLPILAIASLASCAAPRADRVTVPMARTAAPLMQVKPYFFTAPEGFGFPPNDSGIAGTYPKETGEKLVASLSRRRGFRAEGEAPPAATAKSGDPMEVKHLREFIFPTEYLPPTLGPAGKDGVAQVTPATPTAFDKKSVGVSLVCRSRPQKHGGLVVDLDFQRTAFLGFVNYGTPIRSGPRGLFRRQQVVTENRIVMPVFDTRSLRQTLQVKNGDFIAINCPLSRQSETHERFPFEAAKGPKSAGSGGNLIALIQVMETGPTGP